MTRIKNFFIELRARALVVLVRFQLFGFGKKWRKINLCGGSVLIDGYCNVDLSPHADLHIDLERQLLPFSDSSVEIVICISSINYFSRARGEEIIEEVYRVLKQGGIARFASQDLEAIAKKYINKDRGFFFQKLPDGRERFAGETMADKINSWFYGYETTGGKSGKYFYDYETLETLFRKTGFSKVEQKGYRESDIEHIDTIDNREDQMFFLEARK